MVFYYEVLHCTDDGVEQEQKQVIQVAKGLIAGADYGKTLDELIDYFGIENFLELRGFFEVQMPVEPDYLKFILRED